MFCDVLCKQDSKVSQRLIFSWFLIRWLLFIQILIFLLVLSVTEHFQKQLHFTSHGFKFKYFLTLILVVRKPTRPTVLTLNNTIKQGNRHTKKYQHHHQANQYTKTYQRHQQTNQN